MSSISKRMWLIISFCVLGYPNVAFGQGCQYPPCLPNPVPCAHCTGVWTDNSGAVWTISSNLFPQLMGTCPVSGSVLVPHSVPGCPSITYSVTGGITHVAGSAFQRGTTNLTWSASNPSPSGSCGNVSPMATLTPTGSIANNGCDTGSGTWRSRGCRVVSV